MLQHVLDTVPRLAGENIETRYAIESKRECGSFFPDDMLLRMRRSAHFFFQYIYLVIAGTNDAYRSRTDPV